VAFGFGVFSREIDPGDIVQIITLSTGSENTAGYIKMEMNPNIFGVSAIMTFRLGFEEKSKVGVLATSLNREGTAPFDSDTAIVIANPNPDPITVDVQLNFGGFDFG